MKSQKRFSRKFLVVCLICLTAIFVLTGGLALAQESPIELELIPQSEPAVAGQPYRYTIVATHEGSEPVEQAVVTVTTPENTTFLDANNLMIGWYGGGPPIGEPGEVSWYRPEVFNPGEEARFELIVRIDDDVTNVAIKEPVAAVGSEYIARGSSDVVATEAPVITATPTPNWEATEEVIRATQMAQQNLPTPTQTPTPAQVAEAATPEPAAQVSPQPPASGGGLGIPCISGIMLLGMVVVTTVAGRTSFIYKGEER